MSGDVPRLPSYGIYISQLVKFARCCTSVSDFHPKNLQITSKLLTQDYRYHKLQKPFGKFFRSYSELLSKFGDIKIKNALFWREKKIWINYYYFCSKIHFEFDIIACQPTFQPYCWKSWTPPESIYATEHNNFPFF